MRKIAIVGVEGSGKTVMMAAMGEQWECPDERGYFLSPESSETFGFSKTVMNMLRHGQWPNATNHDEIRTLDWSLQRRQGDSLDKIADISLLDYAGEVYRQAFGDEKKEGYEAQVATLRSHVDEADVLIVLVNLSDIINGSMSDCRTLDAMYLTKSVLDYALGDKRKRKPHTAEALVWGTEVNLGDKRKRKPHTAIVFTQADGYREIIDSNGGPSGTLRHYLPHVANFYDNLPILTVSAIDRTVVGDDGLPIPAPDFKSTGLKELMDWILHELYAYERGNAIDLFQKAFEFHSWEDKKKCSMMLKVAYDSTRACLAYNPNDAEMLYQLAYIVQKYRISCDADLIPQYKDEFIKNIILKALSCENCDARVANRIEPELIDHVAYGHVSNDPGYTGGDPEFMDGNSPFVICLIFGLALGLLGCFAIWDLDLRGYNYTGLIRIVLTCFLIGVSIGVCVVGWWKQNRLRCAWQTSIDAKIRKLLGLRKVGADSGDLSVPEMEITIPEWKCLVKS